MKAKKEAEYKAKQKEEKQRLKDLKKAEKSSKSSEGSEGTGKKIGKGVFIIIAVFVILIGAFAFLFFKKPNLLKKFMPGKHKENVTLVNSDSTVASEKQTVKSDTTSMAAEELNAEATESKAKTKVVASEPIAATQPVETPAPKALPAQ